MRQLFLLFLSIVGVWSGLVAQTIDLKEYYTNPPSWEDDDDRPDGIRVKDLSGILTPFIGYWYGEYKDKVYEFYIHKVEQEERLDDFYDVLYANFNVYSRDLSVSLLQSSIKEALGFRQISHPMKGLGYKLVSWGDRYWFWYQSGREGQEGSVYMYLQPDGRLKMYLTENATYRSTYGEQVFPEADVYKGLNEVVYLTRRSFNPLYSKDDSIPCVKQAEPSPNPDLLKRMLEVGRVRCWDSYVNCYKIDFAKRITLGSYLRTAPNDYPRPETEYTKLLVKSAYQDGKTSCYFTFLYNEYFTYRLDFLRQFLLHYKQLMLASMINELFEAGVDSIRQNDYSGDNPRRVFEMYAKYRGVSVSELKRHYLEDGAYLLISFGSSVANIKSGELSTALSKSILEVDGKEEVIDLELLTNRWQKSGRL